MENNLPKKYKTNIFNNFFRKIKLFIFAKRNPKNEDMQTENIAIKEEIKNKDFMEQIKINSDYKDSENDKKTLLDKLIKNPSLLEQFSNERLEKILQFYLEENKEKREELRKINA